MDLCGLKCQFYQSLVTHTTLRHSLQNKHQAIAAGLDLLSRKEIQGEVGRAVTFALLLCDVRVGFSLKHSGYIQNGHDR